MERLPGEVVRAIMQAPEFEEKIDGPRRVFINRSRFPLTTQLRTKYARTYEDTVLELSERFNHDAESGTNYANLMKNLACLHAILDAYCPEWLAKPLNPRLDHLRGVLYQNVHFDIDQAVQAFFEVVTFFMKNTNLEDTSTEFQRELRTFVSAVMSEVHVIQKIEAPKAPSVWDRISRMLAGVSEVLLSFESVTQSASRVLERVRAVQEVPLPSLNSPQAQSPLEPTNKPTKKTK